MGFSNAEMNRFSTASLITRSTNDIQQIQMVTAVMLRLLCMHRLSELVELLKCIRPEQEWNGL